MALVGNLRDLKLPNLVQINCMEKNTAKLTIEHNGKYGFVYFQGGQVVHAEFEPDVGDKAFYRLLGINEGKFKVESGIRPPIVTINTHWNNLLLEGLHELDHMQTDEGSSEQHSLSLLMNVKGVQRSAVISKTGEVLASTFDVDNEIGAALPALVYLEIQKVNELLPFSNPRFVSLIEQKDRVLLTKKGDHIIYLEVEAKYQLDTLIPFISKALS